jgi:hypothetical protein
MALIKAVYPRFIQVPAGWLASSADCRIIIPVLGSRIVSRLIICLILGPVISRLRIIGRRIITSRIIVRILGPSISGRAIIVRILGPVISRLRVIRPRVRGILGSCVIGRNIIVRILGSCVIGRAIIVRILGPVIRRLRIRIRLVITGIRHYRSWVICRLIIYRGLFIYPVLIRRAHVIKRLIPGRSRSSRRSSGRITTGERCIAYPGMIDHILVP